MNFMGLDFRYKPIYRANTGANNVSESSGAVLGNANFATVLEGTILIIDWFRLTITQNATIAAAGVNSFRFQIQGQNFLINDVYIPAIVGTPELRPTTEYFINYVNGFNTSGIIQNKGENISFYNPVNFVTGFYRAFWGWHREYPRPID